MNNMFLLKMMSNCAYLQYAIKFNFNFRKNFLTVNRERYNYTNCFVINATEGEGTPEVRGKIDPGEKKVFP